MHADLEMKCTTRPCLPNPPSLWLPDEPAASAGPYPSTHRRVYDMKLRIFGCVLLLGLSIPITARAQATGQVSGVVTADDGRPVSNAQVSVLTTSLLARTDSVGRYQFARVPAGPHTLRATSLGHAAQEQPPSTPASPSSRPSSIRSSSSATVNRNAARSPAPSPASTPPSSFRGRRATRHR